MHVVEVSSAAASIRLRDGCLHISAEGRTLARVPVADVGTLVLSSPHATCSVTALAALASSGTSVVVCDPSMRPAGMMLPFRKQHEVAKRIAAQATASVPTRKRLWKAVVRSKIFGQAFVLADTVGADSGLRYLAADVRSGDPANVEAQAARVYWRQLMGESFRRRRGEGLTNKMLDYGYAILRATVTRAICAAGLHPSLAVHHRHRANAFGLADDLIEPLRPCVDRIVRRLVASNPDQQDLTPALKKSLAACVEEPVPMQGEIRTARDVAAIISSSFSQVLLAQKKTIALPWIG